jgi:hypothetical protein
MKQLILFSLLLLQMTGNAQLSFTAKSGDAALDANLDKLNMNAKLDLPLFKNDINIDFGIPLPKIDNLLSFMQPADVFMTAQIANLTGKDPDVVATSYKKNKDKGWGVIAKEMGIKPGSPEFHALKGKANDKGNKGKGSSGKGNGKGNGKGKK